MTQSLPALGVQYTSTGPSTPVVTGNAANTLMILGTFPKGPDYPILVDPVDMVALFGDPASPLSVGYTGPYLATFAAQQQPPAAASAIQFLVCRVGVTRGTYVVKDASSGTCFTLSAVGAYAGSNALDLEVTIALTGGKVTAITFTDAVSHQVVGVPLADVSIGGTYDLSSNAQIVAALNATNPLTSAYSVATAVLGASALVPAAVANAAFSAGTDGLGALYNDATVATLLAASLYVPVDYIIAAFDAKLIGPVLLTHIDAALANNDPRKAVLGVPVGTTYAALSGGTYLGGSLSSSRVTVMGHDAMVAVHPATGGDYAFDGSVFAAVHAGLLATSPTEETAINFAANGISAVGTPSDLSAAPQAAQLKALTGAGLTTYAQAYGDPAVRVNDSITTAPQFINGSTQVNQYAYQNTQAIDDAVMRAAVGALAQFKGRPDSPALAGAMEQAVKSAIVSLGSTTNGVNSVTFVKNTSTNQYNGTVSYITRQGIRTINVSTGYTNS